MPRPGDPPERLLWGVVQEVPGVEWTEARTAWGGGTEGRSVRGEAFASTSSAVRAATLWAAFLFLVGAVVLCEPITCQGVYCSVASGIGG